MRPERIVHIGLGAFFRAHQAWYTEHASDADQWGIVAYTGRGPKMAEELMAQGCKYTLVTRHEDHDDFEQIRSVVRAVPASDVEDLKRTISNPAIALVTLTITEAGYQPASDDLTESALGRLALALEERRSAGAGPLALVSCDNMPDNAVVLKLALTELGKGLGSDFLSYLDSLSFVSTSVDRITPTTQPADVALVAEETGFADQSPVATEPFSDWVLSGEFPAGRPNWESAGAQFVTDIEPFENRKLWLLNGAHTLMSSLGRVLGHETVDQAMQDPQVTELIQAWWDEASGELPSEGLNLDLYRGALEQRFLNSRIGYQLSQIAQESLTKLRVRIAPVATARLQRGLSSPGAFAAIASFVALTLDGVVNPDSQSDSIAAALEEQDPALALIALISPALAADTSSVAEIKKMAAGWLGVLS